MQTVYVQPGNIEKTVDEIDAREYISVGIATVRPVDPQQEILPVAVLSPEVQAEVDAVLDQENAERRQRETEELIAEAPLLTIPQLKEALTAGGVQFLSYAAKPVLLETYIKFLKGEDDASQTTQG